MIEEVTHDIMEICNKIFTNIDSVSVNEKEKNHLDSVYKELDILNKKNIEFITKHYYGDST
tara:strand:+ start:362 stop:544 length:183 start_codon:yes stop_codon:yes gene_type:complete